MSEYARLQHAVAPDWVGKPLTGRPDGSAPADAMAEFADRANLGVEKAGTPTEYDDLGLNVLGAASTALSQYRTSTADWRVTRLAEAAAAFAADWAMGNVPILGPLIKKIPGAEAVGEFLSANTQPLLDTHGLKRVSRGKFTIGSLVSDSIHVGAAALEEKKTGSTKAVSRLKARADMGGTSLLMAWLVSKLRRSEDEPDGGS